MSRLWSGIGANLNLKGSNTALIALAAGLICLLVYLPALNCGFVNFDDDVYVVNNPAIRIFDLQFLKWAFTASYLGWWMPLVWVSFALDYRIWELNPFGYHLTNILLHSINAGMVVCIAEKIYRNIFTETSENAFRQKYQYYTMLLLAGVMWGIHPYHVESVAWVVERKNVLNGVFSFGCVLFYLRYVEIKGLDGSRKKATINYIMSVFLLFLSLMTKPVSVVIPTMLLVMDWYPLGRVRKDTLLRIFAEKVPYFIISVAMTLITIYLAAGQSVLVPLHTYPLVSRFISSGAALFDYCMLLFYPVGLVVMYLIPNPLPTSFVVKMVAVICFTVFCLYSAGRRPTLTATWLCFALPILPTLHFFINGAHSIASHFAYLPTVAPSIAAAAIIAQAYKKTASAPSRLYRVFVGTSVAALLLFYVVMSERLLGTWRNSETLWTRVIDVRPVGRAYYYRAVYLIEKGRYPEAADDLKISIRMALSAGYPKVYELYVFRGDALRKAGRYEEALDAFSAAIKLNPLPNYFYHRGLAFKGLGKQREAEEDFSVAGGDTGAINYE